MENARTIDRERGPRAAICARCGGDAEWVFLDTGHTRVEVICPDCGKFAMTRAEFDQVESEIVEPHEHE
ncbi:MAG: hypothetical protein JWO19_3085 [Bryobacterales bacterium]|nr:hypothetical protein [Bryobacterales bacterium]